MKYKVLVEFWSKNNIGHSPDFKQNYVIKTNNVKNCQWLVQKNVEETLKSLKLEGLKLYPKIKILKYK